MANKRTLSFALVAALLAGLFLAPAGAQAQSDDKPGALRYSFDYSPEGGYQGDYVVVINNNYPDGQTMSTGSIAQRIETDIPAFEAADDAIPAVEAYKSQVAGWPDPAVAQMAAMPQDAPWDVGHVGTFILPAPSAVSADDARVAFKVLYVGSHCRIWTPVNPAYVPLDGLDATYAEQAATAFDDNYAFLTARFGDFLDLRGDGKVNILFHDIQVPTISGFTSALDLYDYVTRDGKQVKSNACPIIHIDTFGFNSILRVDAAGRRTQDIKRCFPVLAHEFQHLIYESARYQDPAYRAFRESEAQKGRVIDTMDEHIWMTEFLSAAAAILCYPALFRDDYVPFWYGPYARFDDLRQHFESHGDVKVHPDYMTQRGQNIFNWQGNRDDYSLVAFLAQFAYARAGDGIFTKALALWEDERDERDLKRPVEAVALALGYTDFAQFYKDFVLSVLFNDEAAEDGRYRLFVDRGDGDPAGAREAFSLLRPPLTTGREAKIHLGGFVVFKHLGGVYVPPVTAHKQLQYVGVTINHGE